MKPGEMPGSGFGGQSKRPFVVFVVDFLLRGVEREGEERGLQSEPSAVCLMSFTIKPLQKTKGHM